MTINLFHNRTQHAVGQGGFHTASLCVDGASAFRYVYDCGSTQGPIDQAVESYLSEIGPDQEIDAVFLSHLHMDHVNRLAALLERNRARRLFLPLLDSVDRLLAVSPAFLSGQETELERAYLNNGGQGLREVLNVRDVFEVAPSSERQEDQVSDRDDAEIDWEEIAPGDGFRVAVVPRPSSQRPESESVVGADQYLALGHMTGKVLWEFRWHVDRAVKNKRRKFLDYLNSSQRIADVACGEPLEHWLTRAENLALLMKDEELRDELVSAFLEVRKNLNLVNLTLYSGPVGSDHSWRCADGPDAWRVFEEDLELPRRWTTRVAWLGTGDAKLSTSRRCAELATQFGGRLRNLSTLSAPHHGSNRDLSLQFLNRVNADFATVAFARGNAYGHPGDQAIAQLVSAQMDVIQVTESRHTEWRESFWLEYQADS